MSKKITIEMPEKLYGSIKNYSDKPNSSVNETINHILETFIAQREKRKQDAIFSAIVESGSQLTDVSEAHDRYLYNIE